MNTKNENQELENDDVMYLLACFPNVITVDTLDRQGRKAPFSNHGRGMKNASLDGLPLLLPDVTYWALGVDLPSPCGLGRLQGTSFSKSATTIQKCEWTMLTRSQLPP